MTFLSSMTHTYINLPTKWGYTKFDSSTNQVGIYQLFIHEKNTIKNYIIHPMQSRDTNYIIFPRGLIQMYEKTYHTLDFYMT